MSRHRQELPGANREHGRIIGKDISLVGAQLQQGTTLGHFLV